MIHSLRVFGKVLDFSDQFCVWAYISASRLQTDKMCSKDIILVCNRGINTDTTCKYSLLFVLLVLSSLGLQVVCNWKSYVVIMHYGQYS